MHIVPCVPCAHMHCAVRMHVMPTKLLLRQCMLCQGCRPTAARCCPGPHSSCWRSEPNHLAIQRAGHAKAQACPSELSAAAVRAPRGRPLGLLEPAACWQRPGGTQAQSSCGYWARCMAHLTRHLVPWGILAPPTKPAHRALCVKLCPQECKCLNTHQSCATSSCGQLGLPQQLLRRCSQQASP